MINRDGRVGGLGGAPVPHFDGVATKWSLVARIRSEHATPLWRYSFRTLNCFLGSLAPPNAQNAMHEVSVTVSPQSMAYVVMAAGVGPDTICYLLSVISLKAYSRAALLCGS